MQSPSVAAVNDTSITLQWNDPPPELTGYPKRNITHYAITVTPKDGGDSQVAFVPAEAGAVYTVAGLHWGSTYDIDVNVFIDTEGQGGQVYDMGISLITVNTTGKGSNFFAGIRNN